MWCVRLKRPALRLQGALRLIRLPTVCECRSLVSENRRAYAGRWEWGIFGSAVYIESFGLPADAAILVGRRAATL